MSSSRTKLVSTRLTDAEYAAVEPAAGADTISAWASSRPSNGTTVEHSWNRTRTRDSLAATTGTVMMSCLDPTITRLPRATARLLIGRLASNGRRARPPDGPGIQPSRQVGHGRGPPRGCPRSWSWRASPRTGLPPRSMRTLRRTNRSSTWRNPRSGVPSRSSWQAWSRCWLTTSPWPSTGGQGAAPRHRGGRNGDESMSRSARHWADEHQIREREVIGC
jgi:hypothetical protein